MPFVGYDPFPGADVVIVDPGEGGEPQPGDPAEGQVTVGWVKRQALLLLGQDADSDAAAMATGVGGVEIGSGDQLRTWFNEAAGILARTCLPIPAEGTRTLTQGQNQLALNTLALPTSVARIWAVRSVTIGDRVLKHINRPLLETHHPDYLRQLGNPKYWYENGETFLGVYPAPSLQAAKDLTAAGYGIPKLVVADDELIPWLPKDLVHLVACYIASRVAAKNFEDDDLAPRGALWMNEFDEGRALLWQQIDPDTRAAYYPLPPGRTVLPEEK